MKVIYNNILPFKGFSAMNLFGLILARKEYEPLSEQTLRHEAIHTVQMKELLYVFFYVWYIVEWLIKLFKYGKKAYQHIGFEREAYAYDRDKDYLKQRKHYLWFKFINSNI